MKEMKKRMARMEAALRTAERYLCEDLSAICDEDMREYAEEALASVRKGLESVVEEAKVYVLITDYVYDFEYGHDVQVFSSKAKAKEAFDELVRIERKNAADDGWEMEESELSFSAWEEGRSSENRVTVEVINLKVN